MENAAWTPPSPEELQALLPQFEIQEMLGCGGMGAVFKARQPSLDRLVAIKILASSLINDEDPAAVEGFKTEARALARLSHPAIVGVHDLGQAGEGDDSVLYFVMEYVDGMDLHGWLQSEGGRIEAKAATAILSHVSEALGYAHDTGIIHGDIKPANIMLNLEGQVKIADFGLARFAAEPVEDTGPAMGTPAYSPPEAFDPATPIDHRADLFAAGVMLYELVTGSAPEPGCQLASDVAEDVGPEIDDIIDRAMKPDREERYQSAAELRKDVLAARSGRKPAKARRASPLKTGGPAVVATVQKKSAIGPLIGTVATLALLGGGGYFAYKQLQESKAAGANKAPTSTPAVAVDSAITPEDDHDTEAALSPVDAAFGADKETENDLIADAPAAMPDPAVAPTTWEEPVAPTPPEPDETEIKIASIRDTHLKRIADQLAPPFDKAVAALGENYATALQKPADALSASGNQDIAAIYHAEQALVRSGDIPPTDASDGAPDRIVEMRQLYHESYQGYVAKRTEALPPLIAAWDEELAALETDLEGNDQALAKVADARRGVANDDPFNPNAETSSDVSQAAPDASPQLATPRSPDGESSTPVTLPQLDSPPFQLPDPSQMPAGRVYIVGSNSREGRNIQLPKVGDRDDIVQISASSLDGGHWMALSSSGEVIFPEGEETAWLPPKNLGRCVAINAGNHGLAIGDDGTLHTWHADPLRLPPNTLDNVYMANSTTRSGIALHLDGGISFWGEMYQSNNDTPLSPQAEWVRDVSAVSAAHNGVMLLHKNGTGGGWHLRDNQLLQRNVQSRTSRFVAADGSGMGIGHCTLLNTSGTAEKRNKELDWTGLVHITQGGAVAAGITTDGRISLRPGDEQFFSEDELAEIAAAKNVIDIAAVGSSKSGFAFLVWIEG